MLSCKFDELAKLTDEFVELDKLNCKFVEMAKFKAEIDDWMGWAVSSMSRLS